MKLIFSYLRVSTDKQEKKLSYETQRYKIKEYLDSLNLLLDKEFKDVGSGKDLNREEMQRLMDYIIEFPESTLIVYDQSRLTREPRDLFILQDLFQKTKTKIVGIMSPINLDSDEGEAMASFVSILDKYTRKKINRNIREGVRKKIRETGHWGPKQKFSDSRFNYYYQEKKIRNITSLAKLLGVSWPTIKNYMMKKGLV